MAAFDWSQYLVLAKDLGTRSDEAALRSAISRAYYAAYNHAKLYCNKKGITIRKTGREYSHEDLWNSFLNRGRTLGGVHLRGDRLKRKRVNADYEPEIERLSDMATDSIRDSDAIFSYLRMS